ncbi:MAG: CCA tRNA nucleotidyltransferase [Spirochaetota bacterium]|nr:CCA tRNA nucleotidyltransferase [Spirochaetota bacterium]
MKTFEKKISIPETKINDISAIVKRFQDRGFECYLVGGSVRDLIMGRPVLDYDFATNAHPEDVMKIFRRVVPTGIKHGTVSVLKGNRSYEVTTYRSDGKYIDGRRPQNVIFSETLEEDVKRRDFTINGLAYDTINEKIIDYVDGIEDINKRIIRTIGNAELRFSEDGLRPYRACRFAAKLNFQIEENTFIAISQSLDIAKVISIERVRDEFMKLIEADIPSIGFEYMRESGLLDLFLPELSMCYGVTQNKYHQYDIYYHSLYSCDAIPGSDPIIKLAGLLHDIGKVETRRMGNDGEYTFYNHEVVGAKIIRKIMKRLKFSNEEKARVNNLILNHMFHYTDEWTDGAVRRFMRKVGMENLNDLFILRLADRRGNGKRDGLPDPINRLIKRIDKVIEEENAIKVKDLDINGYEIMEEFNIKPSPMIGHILKDLLELVLDDPDLNKKQILLKKAHEAYNRITNETASE